MEKTKEEQFTVNTARSILNEMELTSIGNGSFIKKNLPTEKVIWAMVRYADAATTSQSSVIKEQAERIEKLEAALRELADEIGKDYRNECDEADWYNNNMPGVGQSLDYKSRPSKPKALEIIDNALTK